MSVAVDSGARCVHRRMCIQCGAPDGDGDSAPRFRKCSGCGLAHYCGEACQRLDWRHHKPICARLRADPQVQAAPKRMLAWFRKEANLQMVTVMCADMLRGIGATAFVRLTVNMGPAPPGLAPVGGRVLAAFCSIDAVADRDATTGGDMGCERDSVQKSREMERRPAGDYSVFVVRFKGEVVLCSALPSISRANVKTAFRFVASSPAAASIQLPVAVSQRGDTARGAEVTKQLIAKSVATCLAN